MCFFFVSITIDFDMTKNNKHLGESLTRRVSVQQAFGSMAGKVVKSSAVLLLGIRAG
jgi:hypothetical protein